MPNRVSQRAKTRPVGPAPMIRTCVSRALTGAFTRATDLSSFLSHPFWAFRFARDSEACLLTLLQYGLFHALPSGQSQLWSYTRALTPTRTLRRAVPRYKPTSTAPCDARINVPANPCPSQVTDLACDPHGLRFASRRETLALCFLSPSSPGWMRARRLRTKREEERAAPARRNSRRRKSTDTFNS